MSLFLVSVACTRPIRVLPCCWRCFQFAQELITADYHYQELPGKVRGDHLWVKNCPEYWLVKTQATAAFSKGSNSWSTRPSFNPDYQRVHFRWWCSGLVRSLWLIHLRTAVSTRVLGITARSRRWGCQKVKSCSDRMKKGGHIAALSSSMTALISMVARERNQAGKLLEWRLYQIQHELNSSLNCHHSQMEQA